ncbi:MAG: hypothetical protein R3195_10400 [Gemmatimonadota bacterium]|nr:hypothetical protein [Gemmatimonadota bacterium]
MHERGDYDVVAAGETPLVRFLFPAPAERRAGAIVAWWEKRRFAYNVIVGAGGLATVGVAMLLTPASGPFPFGPILAVGVMANLCYTLGPIAEVLANRVFGRRLLPLGPTLFRNGLVFSVGLTFVLPMIVMTAATILRILSGLF